MSNFISLKELRERVWPLAMTKNLATDMTGVSLPILDFSGMNDKHPYQTLFMLYFAVPSTPKIHEPSQVSRPYALLVLDIVSGELVKIQTLHESDAPNPLIGYGVGQEVYGLPDDDRRKLQNLFFTRLDEVAQIYATNTVSPEQADHLKDLLDLFENLSEPPLVQDYETFGAAFFSWLREKAKSGK